MANSDLPRDDLFRAVYPGVELRAEGDGAMPVMTGHLAVFNEWTEINSIFEGRFLERLSPGAFTKTINENRDKMRVLFQHGNDPQVGDKPLGPISELREDDTGVNYEVPLLDTSYNRELLPGLQAGLYGASFRFRVMKEDVNRDAKKSAYNPEGLPERTISEVQMREFGPVTFPAYDGATAGIRSLTDVFRPSNLVLERDEPTEPSDDEALPVEEPADATPEDAAADDALDTDEAEPADEVHSGQPSRAPARPTNQEGTSSMTIDEVRSRIDEIGVRFKEISDEFGADKFDADTRAEWDSLKEEREDLQERVRDYDERQAMLRDTAAHEKNLEREPTRTDRRNGPGKRSGVPENIWAFEEYRNLNATHDDYRDSLREGAMRAVEGMQFPHPDADREKQQGHVAKLLDTIDVKDRELAERIIRTGSPTYSRAFGKHLAGAPLTGEEQRVLGVGTQGGNYPVPITLDPTVILTSNGQVNPLREISRVVQITGNVYDLVASTGITAAYSAEAVEASDNSPTLTQPTYNVEKAQAFVPFSIEVGEDWAALQAEMARMLQDAKDALEADKFLTGAGHGSQVPQGLLVGGTAVVSTAATATFAVADLYSLQNALAPRWRPRASFVANNAQFNRIRQFDTAGGASLWVQLGDGTPSRLLNYPTFEYSNMVTTISSNSSIVTYGDFSQFVIVDRIGLNIEVVPHLFGTTNNYPTGQRGLYAYWRNTSGVATQLAFKTLKAL